MSPTNPRPWLQEGAPEPLRELLESAALDEPTAAQLGSLESKLSALFTTPPPEGGEGPGGGEPPPDASPLPDLPPAPPAASAAGAGASAGSAAVAGLAKTLVVTSATAVAVGVGGFQAGRVYERRVEPPPPIVAAAPTPPPIPEPVVEVPPAPDPAAPPAPPPKPKVAAKSDVPDEREVALLQQAMAAIQAGRANEGLELLERHRARYEAGVLAQEREVLSIQALMSLGRTGDARSKATAFRRRWPTSPHLLRIDSLLKGP